MKVLAVGNMYPPHHLGGYELVWQSAMRHLSASGHEVRVLTTDWHKPDADAEDDDYVSRELQWYWQAHEFPRLSLRERWRLERHNRDALKRQLYELKPDVVAWWAMGGMSMAMIGQVREDGLPAVGFVHDEWLLYGPRVDQWQRALRRLGTLGSVVSRLAGVPVLGDLPASARWVFVSETTRRHAESELGPLHAAAVAHSGIDLPLWKLSPEKPWAWNLLCPGRLDERKGTHVAIASLAKLPRARLLVAGEGDPAYERRLHNLVRELGIGERVGFDRLTREGLAEAYARSDAVVFPVQWEEPWGLVPLEAMASGIPVVASGAGGSREYLRTEENCLLYEPRNDPIALASQLKRLAHDESLRRRLRIAGRSTAERNTQERFDEAVEAHLAEACANRLGRHP